MNRLRAPGELDYMGPCLLLDVGPKVCQRLRHLRSRLAQHVGQLTRAPLIVHGEEGVGDASLPGATGAPDAYGGTKLNSKARQIRN